MRKASVIEMTPDLAASFLDQSRYYLSTEYRTKLRRAVAAIPPDRLWWCPELQSNSAGNLILHLTGNIRQWIVSGVGGTPVSRNRAAEFEARDGASAEELLTQLDRALGEVDSVLAGLNLKALLEPRTIQGRDVTVLAAVLHVVEHFAYHLGQIVYIAKLCSPGAIQFYEDAGGLAVPRWREGESSRTE